MAAGVLLIGLAWYDIWRSWPFESRWINGVRIGYAPPLIPSFGIFLFRQFFRSIPDDVVSALHARYADVYERIKAKDNHVDETTEDE